MMHDSLMGVTAGSVILLVAALVGWWLEAKKHEQVRVYRIEEIKHLEHAVRHLEDRLHDAYEQMDLHSKEVRVAVRAIKAKRRFADEAEAAGLDYDAVVLFSPASS